MAEARGGGASGARRLVQLDYAALYFTLAGRMGSLRTLVDAIDRFLT